MGDPRDTEATLEPEVLAPEIDVGTRAMVRAENDALFAIAAQRPRNSAKVLARAKGELEIVKDEAKTCFYTIPYKNPDGGVTNVTGPSIKAAQILARLWGNNAVSGRIVEETEDHAIVEGVFIDAETAFYMKKQVRVSRFEKKRGGGTRRLDDQRWGTAIQAGVSKAVRNAILSGLPAWLSSQFNAHARAIAAGLVKDKIPALIARFAELGVTREHIEKKIGCKIEAANPDQFADLVGFGQAIADGQAAAADIFESMQPAGPPPETQPMPGVPTPAQVVSAPQGGAPPAGPPPQMAPPTAAPVPPVPPPTGDATAATPRRRKW